MLCYGRTRGYNLMAKLFNSNPFFDENIFRRGINPNANKRKEVFSSPWLTPESAQEQRQQLAQPRTTKPNPNYRKSLESILGGQNKIYGVWDGALDGLSKAIAGWRLGQERTRENEYNKQREQELADFNALLFGTEKPDLRTAIAENPHLLSNPEVAKSIQFHQMLFPESKKDWQVDNKGNLYTICLLYTSPSPRDS